MTRLRAARPEDANALADVATRAFVEKFGHLYQPQDLAAFLAEERTRERYLRHLSDDDTRVQVAEVDGRLAAYCVIVRGKCFEAQPEPRPQRPVFVSQLYTDPELTGRGLGAALMEWAIAEARAWGGDALQLSVFSENSGAQRFYQRYGFSKVADIDFWVGSHRDHEFLYELPL